MIYQHSPKKLVRKFVGIMDFFLEIDRWVDLFIRD